MVSINKLIRVFTREGAPAKAFEPEQELRRAVMNCLLWEDQFYEDGVSIADRIAALVPHVEAREGRGSRGRGARKNEAAPRAAACWCAKWRG